MFINYVAKGHSDGDRWYSTPFTRSLQSAFENNGITFPGNVQFPIIDNKLGVHIHSFSRKEIDKPDEIILEKRTPPPYISFLN